MSFPDLPYSLQNTCLLHISFHLGTFPVETLALLPIKFRKMIASKFSLADILHLNGTNAFIKTGETSNHVYSKLCKEASQMLHLILFQNRIYLLPHFFSINVDHDPRQVPYFELELICKHFSSLKPTLIEQGGQFFCLPACF